MKETSEEKYNGIGVKSWLKRGEEVFEKGKEKGKKKEGEEQVEVKVKGGNIRDRLINFAVGRILVGCPFAAMFDPAVKGPAGLGMRAAHAVVGEEPGVSDVPRLRTRTIRVARGRASRAGHDNGDAPIDVVDGDGSAKGNLVAALSLALGLGLDLLLDPVEGAEDLRKAGVRLIFLCNRKCQPRFL